MKKIITMLLLILFLCNCKNKIAGTLGGGNVYEFNCNEEKLNECLDSFSKNTKFLNIPKKWEKYNNWEKIGYGFLKGKVFYINEDKEINDEMYYVSVWSDSTKSAISYVSIRSVFRIKGEEPGWLYFEDISKSDANRIEIKFKQIILNKLKCNYSTYKLKNNYLNE